LPLVLVSFPISNVFNWEEKFNIAYSVVSFTNKPVVYRNIDLGIATKADTVDSFE
jgi:hypothetical protein